VTYVDAGAGPVVLFLHGNPTSSYVWRNVIDRVGEVAQCVAPDLLGFGESTLADGCHEAPFEDQGAVLDRLVERVGAESVVVVVQGWGSIVGLDWARRNPLLVRGIVHLEAIVRPLRWSDWPPKGRGLIAGMRSDAGEAMVLQENLLIEALLPTWIVRTNTDEELESYRSPFTEAGTPRQPMLGALRQIPIEGLEGEADAIVAAYSEWLSVTNIPKLALLGEPGWLVRGSARAHCRSWPNQTEVVIPGRHLLQEDSPGEVATAIIDWLATLD